MRMADRFIAMTLLTLGIATALSMAAEAPSCGVRPLNVTYYFLPG